MSDQTFVLDVEGMHCGGCVRRVQGALEKVPGVTVDAVAVGQASGSFDPSEADMAALVAALGAAGYPAREKAQGPGTSAAGNTP